MFFSVGRITAFFWGLNGAMTALQIRQRIGAFRVSLDNLPDASRHAALSRTQSRALQYMIDKEAAGLSPEDCGDLSTLVASVHWQAGDDVCVLEALARASGTQGQQNTRKARQNFKSIFEFFTQRLWQRALSPEMSADGVLLLFAQRMVRAGARNLTEHSMKFLCSVWLHVVMNDPSTLDETAKKRKLQHVRK